MKNRNIFLPSYTIGLNSYDEIADLALNYGNKVVFIGGKTALEKASELVLEKLKDRVKVLDILWYGGEASYENVEKLKNNKNVKDADIIFAIGGGKAIDTCKVLSGELKKSLFVFPTIASTCASVTAVCAVYKNDGSFDSLYWREKPAEHTFINTKIIAEAPTKYLWAGIGDTLAKGYEPEFSSRGKELDYYNSVGIKLSQLCQEPLVKYGEKALLSVEKNETSLDLDEIILSIIVNTGLVSNHVINDYNSCVAHAICYGFSTIDKVEKNHLHGEIVSYGVLVQLMLDNKIDELKKLLTFYKKIGLPTSYKYFKVNMDEMEQVFEKAISVNDVKVCAIDVTKNNLREAVLNLEKYN